MKKLLIGIVLAAPLNVFAAAPLNVHTGTWALIEEKSRPDPAWGKISKIVVSEAGDKIKIVSDGVDGHGKPVHSEWTGQFDGNDYPVTGDPTADTRAYKPVDALTLLTTVKKKGRPDLTGRVAVSPDGAVQTSTLSGTDAAGKHVVKKSVYERR